MGTLGRDLDAIADRRTARFVDVGRSVHEAIVVIGTGDDRADELVERGRASLRDGDATGARDAVAPLAGDGACGDVLEILARADYLELRFTDAITTWERAYAAHRAAGDRLGAVRVARTLAGTNFSIVGDLAVSGGWLARAETLLAGDDETPERGWVVLNTGMFEADRREKHVLFQRALTIGRASGDLSLEVSTLAYYGASLVCADELAQGMRMLDEALAALAGDEVDDFFIVEEVFCQLFSACEHARDIVRADQWIRVGDAMAARRKLPAVSAFCHTHYGGVLTIAGRWQEADHSLTEAVRLWGLGQRSMLRGGALIRLADLRVRQGRIEEAAELLNGLDPRIELEATRPRAAICLAQGDVAQACDLLDGALSELGDESSESAPLLELLVEVHVARGDLPAAATALQRLEVIGTRNRGSDYVTALVSLARGRWNIASGEGDPQASLRSATRGFMRAGVPLESALARLLLAEALGNDRRDAAVTEARNALDVFEGLQAERHADAANALLRTLGVRTSTARTSDSSGLTKREREVLDLLGRGLTNPEIAQRLYISRKTVEHHVTNVLAKLGLRSRAEAAAHAARAASAPAEEPARD